MDGGRGERQARRAREGPRDAPQSDEGRLLTEELPFEVELERRPVWVDVASALVIAAGIAVALKLVPMLVLLPPLALSAVGRRFGSSAVRAVVAEDESLTLGELAIPRAELEDVWLDDDGVDPRVVIAWGPDRDLAALWFENRAQARRFANALGATRTTRSEDLGETPELVAGYRPRKVDLLGPLRFVAIAIAFFGVGSWYGAFALVFFATGAWAWAHAKQLVVSGDNVSLASAFGAQTFTTAELSKVDVDEGTLTLVDGRTLTFAREHSRDRHLTTPVWTDSLRRRVLKRLTPADKKEGPTG